MTNFWEEMSIVPVRPLTDGESAYALVDGAQIPQLRSVIRQTIGITEQAPVLGTSIAPDLANATPHLLRLADEQAFRSMMRAFTRVAAQPGALSWIVSPLEIDELARRLRTRLDAELPDNFECMNRYFDGRVAPHLYACLNEAQRNVFFSPASQWWVLGHDLQWQTLPCTFQSIDEFMAPLRLDEQQQAYLIDACYPYAMIDHFRLTDEDLLLTIPAADQYRFFRDALAHAERFGIQGGADAVLFCTLSLTREETFFNLPSWQDSLLRVQKGEATLRQVLVDQHS